MRKFKIADNSTRNCLAIYANIGHISSYWQNNYNAMFLVHDQQIIEEFNFHIMLLYKEHFKEDSKLMLLSNVCANNIARGIKREKNKTA